MQVRGLALDMQSRLPLLRAGSKLFSWAYFGFEKLSILNARQLDLSRDSDVEGEGSDPAPLIPKELT